MRFKILSVFITILFIFALVTTTGCGSSSTADKPAADKPAEEKPAFDAYRDMLIPMAQEKVDAGELTPRQADYIIYLSRQGKYPRGATPSFSDALDNPPEVPADWDGPKEVKQ